MTGPTPIDVIGIVIPVRNEQELLPRCLLALSAALEAVSGELMFDRPRIDVVIVLTRCTDASASIAARWPEFSCITSDSAAIGTARRSGVRHVLAGLPTEPQSALERVWIATTDADAAVPANWLTTQLAYARNGTELVMGTVHSAGVPSLEGAGGFSIQRSLRDGHPFVHSVNLGVRADRYLAAGEFTELDGDEDLALAQCLRDRQVIEARTALIPVLAAGRLNGRSPAEMERYLRLHRGDFQPDANPA